MNKCILYGNVGKDAEMKHLESGKSVAKFSLATNKVYTNNANEKVTETQWHNIVLWNKLADLAEKYVRKGNSVIIEGEIQYRQYDDKEGNTKYITEIIADRLHFAGNKSEDKKDSKKSANISNPDELERAEDDPSFVPEFNYNTDLPF